MYIHICISFNTAGSLSSSLVLGIILKKEIELFNVIAVENELAVEIENVEIGPAVLHYWVINNVVFFIRGVSLYQVILLLYLIV